MEHFLSFLIPFKRNDFFYFKGKPLPTFPLGEVRQNNSHIYKTTLWVMYLESSHRPPRWWWQNSEAWPDLWWKIAISNYLAGFWISDLNKILHLKHCDFLKNLQKWLLNTSACIFYLVSTCSLCPLQGVHSLNTRHVCSWKAGDFQEAEKCLAFE